MAVDPKRPVEDLEHSVTTPDNVAGTSESRLPPDDFVFAGVSCYSCNQPAAAKCESAVNPIVLAMMDPDANGIAPSSCCVPIAWQDSYGSSTSDSIW